jgi:hypothetical protein
MAGDSVTPEEFAACIAQVESGDKPTAWGDNGLAMGRYQVHPSWVWTWATYLKLQPTVSESWDHFIGRLVQGFFSAHNAGMHPGQIAMYFHLGHLDTEQDSDWDVNYAKEFAAAAVKVA